MTFEEIFEGRIPETIEESTDALRGITTAARISVAVSGMLLAAAWLGHFANRRSEWMKWALETTGLTDNDIYHRLAIGRMLLALKPKAVLFRKLTRLNGDCLLILTQLTKTENNMLCTGRLESFLAVHPEVWELDRDKLRDLVRAELGKAPKKPKDGTLPGFEDLLGSLVRLDLEKDYYDLKDRQTADQSFLGGLRLLASYIRYEKSAPDQDTVKLLKLKHVLLNEVKAIEEAIADKEEDKEENDYHGYFGFDQGVCPGGEDAAEVYGDNTAGSAKTDHNNIIIGFNTAGECGDNTGSASIAGCGDNTAAAENRCGDNTAGSTEAVSEPAGEMPSGGFGAAEVHRDDGEAQTGDGTRDNARGVPLRGGAQVGGVPDPAAGRQKRREPSDLAEPPEMDGAHSGGGETARACADGRGDAPCPG